MFRLLVLLAVLSFPAISIAQTSESMNAAQQQMQQMQNLWMMQNAANNLKRQVATIRMGSEVRKVTYMVELKDKTMVAVSSNIMFDEQENSFILVQPIPNKINQTDALQQETIYPDNTNSIVRLSKRGRILVEGVPFHHQWLFPVAKGKITGYSLLPVLFNPTAEHYKYLQLADGPIQPISQNLLLEMVGNNKRAKKLVSSDRIHEAIMHFNK